VRPMALRRLASQHMRTTLGTELLAPMQRPQGRMWLPPALRPAPAVLRRAPRPRFPRAWRPPRRMRAYLRVVARLLRVRKTARLRVSLPQALKHSRAVDRLPSGAQALRGQRPPPRVRTCLRVVISPPQAPQTARASILQALNLRRTLRVLRVLLQHAALSWILGNRTSPTGPMANLATAATSTTRTLRIFRSFPICWSPTRSSCSTRRAAGRRRRT
jgi:hypothetical protein